MEVAQKIIGWSDDFCDNHAMGKMGFPVGMLWWMVVNDRY